MFQITIEPDDLQGNGWNYTVSKDGVLMAKGWLRANERSIVVNFTNHIVNTYRNRWSCACCDTKGVCTGGM